MFRNVENHLPGDAVTYPRRTNFLTNRLEYFESRSFLVLVHLDYVAVRLSGLLGRTEAERSSYTLGASPALLHDLIACELHSTCPERREKLRSTWVAFCVIRK